MMKHQSSGSIPNLGLPQKGENLLSLQPIDGDIKSQATDFVQRQFSIIPFINEQQKDTITRWLGEHVQAERHGWSKKLELTIKEIEKQRRVTLLSTSRIQTLNAQVEQVLQKETVTSETNFADDSYDPIQELEQNVMALCEMATQMFDDKTQCLKLLGVSEKYMQNYGYIVDLLRKKLNIFDAGVKNMKEQNDVDLLTPRSHVSHASKEGVGTPRRAGGIKGGKKSKAESEYRLLTLKPVETVVNFIPFVVTHEVNLDKRVGAGKDVQKRRDNEKTGKKIHRDPEMSDAKKRAKSDPDLVLGKAEVQKIRLISPEYKKDSQEKLIEDLKTEMRELETIVSQKDKDLEKYRHHIKTLKHMYHYGNLGLKVNGKFKESNFIRTNDAAKFSQKESLAVMSHSLPSIAPEQTNQTGKADDVALSLDSVLFPPAKTSVSRCLRCRRLYRLQDNHKKACHYHPRSKRKLEKYSDNGKLQTVTFVWDCCHQDFDHEGCCADEHV